MRVSLAAADLPHSCPDGMTTSVDLEMPYSALRSSSMCTLSATTDTNIHRDVVAWSLRLLGWFAAFLSSVLDLLGLPEHVSS